MEKIDNNIYNLLKKNKVGLFGYNKIPIKTLKYYCKKEEKDINEYLIIPEDMNMEIYAQENFNKIKEYGIYKIDKMLVNYYIKHRMLVKSKITLLINKDKYKDAKIKYYSDMDNSKKYEKLIKIEAKYKNSLIRKKIIEEHTQTETIKEKVDGELIVIKGKKVKENLSVDEINKKIDRLRIKKDTVTKRQLEVIENAREKVKEAKEKYEELLNQYNSKIKKGYKKVPEYELNKAKNKLLTFENKLIEYENKYNKENKEQLII